MPQTAEAFALAAVTKTEVDYLSLNHISVLQTRAFLNAVESRRDRFLRNAKMKEGKLCLTKVLETPFGMSLASLAHHSV